MIKPTKRKAFNFLRSYFDVLNELEKDKDKLDFLLSIINKQFLDEDPKQLNFIVNLCYESQRHQIESSVKGWKRASNETLVTTPSTTPPTPKGLDPKEEEEEEEEEEEVKDKPTANAKAFKSEGDFLEFFNKGVEKLFKRKGLFRTLTKTDLNNLKRLNTVYTALEFKQAMVMMSKNDWVKSTNNYTPTHLLRDGNFTKYLNQTDVRPMAQGLIEGN
jgi:hypothetical protein